ncbi:MAG TPA: GGDEF domain-containing protein [Spirochaetia bacterium]|nr:GGDEF domain-containing protein [Spirochaetaceae bacterium]HPE88956.1 GGDEF domain-containing protein [Spirochaetales bacterium]HRW22784.1 GGDEF domain-containing protein [Spirochaetia bacterium]
MKREPLLIAICSFVVIGAIVAWPVLRVAKALDSGEEAARASFSELRRDALNTIYAPEDSVDGPWRAKVAGVWSAQPNLLAVIVKDADGEVLYARPGSSPYYSRTDDGLGFERPEGSTTRFSGPISSGMSVEALYVTLTQEAAFYPIRDGAVALASLLALLVAWLLVATNAKPEPALEAARGTPEAVGDDWEPSIPELIPPESSLYAEDPFFDDAPSSEAEPEAEPAVDDQAAPAGRPEPKAAFIGRDDLPEGSLDGPRGLFDAETGLGWEAYLRERLSAELRRSASFEQDLSLLIASIDGAERGDEEFNLFASSVRDYFSFKDMAFLFGNNGAALILPNMDVDHALRMCGELMKKLSASMAGRLPGGVGVCMGLSSRAGRLVDADRIIGESMAALSKARSDGQGGIMAFRPDPEKFRAYLAGQ